MTGFVKTVIREDARYFLDHGFIDEQLFRRVLAWQRGSCDGETAGVITGWLRSDIEYINEVEGTAARQLWYIWPAVKLALWVLKRQLRKAIKEIGG